MSKLLSNSKYGTFKTIEELISNWDDAKIPDDLMDIVACFICRLDERVHMGPNKNNFFKDPAEHRKSYRPELWFEDATKVSKKHHERVELIQKLLLVDTEAAAPKTLTLPKPAHVTKENSSMSSSSTAEQAILTSKYHKKTKFRFVDQTFQKKLAVQSKCILQKVAKGFCLSVVHSGVNPLSESVIIEMYNTTYRGIYDHHLVQEESYKELYGLQKEKTIMVPQQCCLDKNNIIKYEKAILKAYKKNPDSKYSIIKKAPYWGIMHDGIQKFSIITVCFFKLLTQKHTILCWYHFA